MTKMEAIKAATSASARVMQWGDRVGTIKAVIPRALLAGAYGN